MPLVRDGRPLKRWRYVGAFGERLMLCAGIARIGVFRQAFWAVWDRERQVLHSRTRVVLPRRGVRLPEGRVLLDDGGVRAELSVDAGAGVETVSEHGPSYIWTRKHGAARVHGWVELGGERIALDALGCVDDSAGYHARHTAWEWSAGGGVTRDGRTVGWNLVTGLHDAPIGSERTLWVDGEPAEAPPVTFTRGLDAVRFASGEELRFTEEARRERREELGLLASDYVQPFGTFAGTLPGGLVLVAGRGVMERHTARW
jgi:hypothetical protein